MKYICLGYIEPNKFETMSESERNARGRHHESRIIRVAPYGCFICKPERRRTTK
jgi:hypothetical protein